MPRPRARAGCRHRRHPRGARRARPRPSSGSRSALHAFEPRDLLPAHFGVVDGARVDEPLVGEAVLVHADDGLLATIDGGLAPGRGFLDAQLGHPRLDGLRHATEPVDLFDQLPRGIGEALRQRLDVVRPAERIDDMGDTRLLGEDQLRVARDPRRELASAGRSPRRTSSCGGSASRRARRRAPRTRYARRCCTDPVP